MSEQLYFIAIIPPEEIQEEITKLKHEVWEKFGSKHALNAPPHITLHMPFKWKDKKMDQLTCLIQTLNQGFEPFEIQLEGFDFFEPRVVFVDVVANEDLSSLQKTVVDHCRGELKIENGNYKNQPFHPHVTIAFRDLKKKMFYEAKNYFEHREVRFRFEASRVALLKHEERHWEIMQ